MQAKGAPSAHSRIPVTLPWQHRILQTRHPPTRTAAFGSGARHFSQFQEGRGDRPDCRVARRARSSERGGVPGAREEEGRRGDAILSCEGSSAIATRTRKGLGIFSFSLGPCLVQKKLKKKYCNTFIYIFDKYCPIIN